MEKINERIETIFSHAVALGQCGHLKNQIFCIGKSVFIKNYDDTVLMNFPLKKNEGVFDNPVMFRADDYEGKKFYIEGDRIVFETNENGFTKKVYCKLVGIEPKDIERLYNSFEFKKVNKISLTDKILSVLDDDLSHIEFSAENGNIKFTQRNIYTGTVIEIEREKQRGFGVKVQDTIKNFEPVGIRTNDFKALFSFTNQLDFYFVNDKYFWVENLYSQLRFRAVVGLCKYDELGNVEYLKGGNNNGRKK